MGEPITGTVILGEEMVKGLATWPVRKQYAPNVTYVRSFAKCAGELKHALIE